jgi:DNA-binding transcriptional ArsR family regulator
VDFIHPIEAVVPGVQGRILAVLAESTGELSLRTLARLANVSIAQASRVLPDLVELGMVERREVPPSSQFRLNRDHVAGRLVVELARVRDAVLAELGGLARALPVPPASVIVFGSFARAEADRTSDIDTMLVRPLGVKSDDPAWERSIDIWRSRVRTITGNHVEVLDVGADELPARLGGRQPLWRDIRSDATAVFGRSLSEFEDMTGA